MFLFWSYCEWDVPHPVCSFWGSSLLIYIEPNILVCWFCFLLLCWKHLPSLKGFFVEFKKKWFFKYKIMLPANQSNLTLFSFLFGSLYIILWSLLLRVRFRPPHWIEIEKVNTLNSFQILEEILHVFPLNIMLAVSLSYIAFILLRYVPSISSFFKAFAMKECWPR